MVRKAPDLESEVREAQEQKRRLHQDHLSGREKLEGEVSATRKDVEKLKELESELVRPTPPRPTHSRSSSTP